MNLVTVHGKLELEARDEAAGIVEEGGFLVEGVETGDVFWVEKFNILDG